MKAQSQEGRPAFERINCACPRIDARDCILVRCNDDLRIMLDVEPSKLLCGDDDECECACHEPDDDESEE